VISSAQPAVTIIHRALTVQAVFVPRDVLRQATTDIEELCERAIQPQIFDWVTDAERNLPHVSGGGKNAFGQPESPKLVLSEGWRRLQDVGSEIG
jgi:hypothetical protein